MKNKLFLIVITIMSVFQLTAQTNGVSINPTGAAPDPSAMLDINGVSKGVLINRMTTEERNAIVNPADGLQIYNTTTQCLNIRIGSTWKQVCGDCDFNSPVAANNGPICEGSTLNLSATTIPGATYQWTGPNGFSSTEQNPSIPNTTAGSSGSYSVSATLDGCTSQLQTTVATINATPATPVAGNNGPVCIGNVLSLSATTVVGATYSWSGPNGYSAGTQNPIITSAQLINQGVYNVTATVNGCISAAGTTTVSTNDLPANPGSITGVASVCPNSSGLVYSISSIPNTDTYNWLVPAGAGITLNSGPSITVTFGAIPAGNITVSATNVCGTSELSTFYVATESVCSPMIFNNTSSGRTGSTQNFTVPPGVTSVTIDAYGAQGGSIPGRTGGKGAQITGTFSVTPGQVLTVAVGQAGSTGSGSGDGSGGGGGASYVTYNSFYLLIAGGGGGAGNASNGQDGQAGQNGTAGGGTAGSSGNAGNGGSAPGCCGCSAGAGWYQNSGPYGGWSTGAASLFNGGQGAQHQNGTGGDGGYGGAGSGAYGGGGGGGYSGGGADCGSPGYQGGGGGGSINTGNSQSATAGYNEGHGKVIFSW